MPITDEESPQPLVWSENDANYNKIILKNNAYDTTRDEQKTTAYEMPFRVNKSNESLCTMTLNKKQQKFLRKAILHDWYFQVRLSARP